MRSRIRPCTRYSIPDDRFSIRSPIRQVGNAIYRLIEPQASSISEGGDASALDSTPPSGAVCRRARSVSIWWVGVRKPQAGVKLGAVDQLADHRAEHCHCNRDGARCGEGECREEPDAEANRREEKTDGRRPLTTRQIENEFHRRRRPQEYGVFSEDTDVERCAEHRHRTVWDRVDRLSANPVNHIHRIEAGESDCCDHPFCGHRELRAESGALAAAKKAEKSTTSRLTHDRLRLSAARQIRLIRPRWRALTDIATTPATANIGNGTALPACRCGRKPRHEKSRDRGEKPQRPFALETAPTDAGRGKTRSPRSAPPSYRERSCRLPPTTRTAGRRPVSGNPG